MLPRNVVRFGIGADAIAVVKFTGASVDHPKAIKMEYQLILRAG